MKNLFSIKYLAFFFTAFAIGFGTAKTINHSKTFNNGFSEKEAISHLGKSVQSLCNANFVTVNATTGKTELTQNLGGENYILIHWDYSLRGKHELIWYSKKEYEKCVIEVGAAER